MIISFSLLCERYIIYPIPVSYTHLASFSSGVITSFSLATSTAKETSVGGTSISVSYTHLVAKDANGVILKELPYGTSDVNYDFSLTTANGYRCV